MNGYSLCVILANWTFMLFELPCRIAVIGTTCSGKTTFARKLAHSLSIDHIELDQLHWRENWQEAPLQEFRFAVDTATDQTSWVVDGNYSKVRDIVWRKAKYIIWLDYPFLTVLRRCLARTIKRVITREKLFSNNRETFVNSFLSQDSIVLWMLKTYNRRKKQYPMLFKDPNHKHLHVIRISSDKDEEELLQSACTKCQDYA